MHLLVGPNKCSFPRVQLNRGVVSKSGVRCLVRYYTTTPGTEYGIDTVEAHPSFNAKNPGIIMNVAVITVCDFQKRL